MRSLRGWVLLSFLTVAFLAEGCASASKVPSIRTDDLPSVSFKAITPRSLLIEVKNNREANRKAGNSAEVERAVSEAVASALSRGGIKIKSEPRNVLSLVLEDYAGADSADEACVKIVGKLAARWGSSVSAAAEACYSMQRETGFAMPGDLSDSYTLALKILLNELDKHQMDLLRGR